jgi:CrcB protein
VEKAGLTAGVRAEGRAAIDSGPDRRPPPRLGPLLAVIATGGAAGSCLRYTASLLWPTRAGAFAWTTVGINVVGCATIGILMAVLSSGWAVHPLVRPFVGVGLLGGFTTFSTSALDARLLAVHGRAGMALAYLAVTVVGSMAGVSAAVALTRRVLAGARGRPGRPEGPRGCAPPPRATPADGTVRPDRAGTRSPAGPDRDGGRSSARSR